MTTPAIEAVEITVENGVILRGQLHARTNAWIVLLHDTGEEDDLDRWAPLDEALASNDWTVLNVDLRGHGASDGDWDPAHAQADIEAIVAHLRQLGASVLAIAAAGASAIHTLRIARDVRADSLILLSPAIDPDQPVSDLRGAGEAKLIIVGGADAAARSSGERLCKSAIGWVVLLNLPSYDQGTDLLRGNAAPLLMEHIVKFLGEQRHLARLRARAPRDRAGVNLDQAIASTGGMDHS
jgi:pimeloyl-ACP methyl ester carboxylesterase